MQHHYRCQTEAKAKDRTGDFNGAITQPPQSTPHKSEHDDPGGKLMDSCRQLLPSILTDSEKEDATEKFLLGPKRQPGIAEKWTMHMDA